MALSAPAVFAPFVRLELLRWDPLHGGTYGAAQVTQKYVIVATNIVQGSSVHRRNALLCRGWASAGIAYDCQGLSHIEQAVRLQLPGCSSTGS